jgi:hypothetical protein
MCAPQVRQQLELRIFADRIFRARDLNTGFVKLHEQAFDWYFQDLCKFCDGDIRH